MPKRVEHRRSRRAWCAKRFELADVRFDSGVVAAGPSREHEMVDVGDIERCGRQATRDGVWRLHAAPWESVARSIAVDVIATKRICCIAVRQSSFYVER